MRRTCLSLLYLLSSGCQSTESTDPLPEDASRIIASVFSGEAGRWVDLTHSFSARSIYWPTDTIGFVHEQLAFGPSDGGWFYASYRYSAAEHGGTHLDAPIHFAEGRQTSDEIPLSRLIGPAVVVDVASQAAADADYQVGIDDFTRWEAANGQIPNGSILLVRTGWDSRYGDRTAYLGTDLTGAEAVAALHFPGLAPDAAQWLVDNRQIVAFGLDTPSIDYGQSPDFQAHVILNSRDVPGFENLTGLEQLPPVGAFVVALPMKIEAGSGGPLRIVGFVPDGG